MTWEQLRQMIEKMPRDQRSDPVVFIVDYNGPDRRALLVDLVQADQDLFFGFSVGSECVVGQGEWFLADSDDDLAAGSR